MCPYPGDEPEGILSPDEVPQKVLCPYPGDDSKRPLCPNEEVPQVVSCVVLPQLTEAVKHFPRRHHRLHAQNGPMQAAVAKEMQATWDRVNKEVLCIVLLGLNKEEEQEEETPKSCSDFGNFF